MIQDGIHKTEEGFKTIIDLAYNMNKEGKRRKLTKEEYIKQCYEESGGK